MTTIPSAFINKYRSTGDLLAQVLSWFSLDLVGIVAEYAREIRLVERIALPRVGSVWANARLFVSPRGELVIFNAQQLTTCSRDGHVMATWNSSHKGFLDHQLAMMNPKGEIVATLMRHHNRSLEIVAFSSTTDDSKMFTDYRKLFNVGSFASLVACVGDQVLLIDPDNVEVWGQDGHAVASWPTSLPRRSDRCAISKQGHLCFLDYTKSILTKHDIINGHIKETIAIAVKEILKEPVPFMLDSTTDQFAILLGKNGLSGARIHMFHADGSIRQILEFSTKVVDCCFDSHGKFYVLMMHGYVQVYDE